MREFRTTVKMAYSKCGGCKYEAEWVIDSDVDPAYAVCPACHGQSNPVKMGKEITGVCEKCSHPMDNHVFGRMGYACPPGPGVAL